MRSVLLLALALTACDPAEAPSDRPKPRPICAAMISSALAAPDGQKVTGLECIR